MGIFDGKSPVGSPGSADIPLFIVDNKKIAERPVDKIEADVGADLVAVAIILEKGTQKHSCAEVIVDAGAE